MISTIKRDITTVPNGFILHQVNTRGVMGGGLARQLREKFPECATEYTEMCNNTPKVERYKLLGTAHFAPLNAGRVVVVNLFGQLDTSTGCRETEYHALWSALKDFKAKLHFAPGAVFPPIHIPYQLGCGLGGGDWKIVTNIIEAVLSDVKNPVFICQLP